MSADVSDTAKAVQAIRAQAHLLHEVEHDVTPVATQALNHRERHF